MAGTVEIHPSAVNYTSLNLRFYDFVVLQFSNSFAWDCPTADVLIPFFQKHIGARAHMDIGVGTGYYLAASATPLEKVETLTLVDLNPETLRFARNRLEATGHTGKIETLKHDIFTPFPSSLQGQYDAVSLFYVFHCLPGRFPDKADEVFTQLKPVLKPNGVVYGATVQNKNHNWIGSCLVDFYNSKGVFSNYEDSMGGLDEALRRHFVEVEVKVVGRIALFVGRTPIVA